MHEIGHKMTQFSHLLFCVPGFVMGDARAINQRRYWVLGSIARRCAWAMLCAAAMLLLAGRSYAEVTKRVLLVGRYGLPSVEIQVPQRLIAPSFITFRPYHDFMLHLSFLLPVHPDNTAIALDFMPDSIKGEGELRASTDSTVFPKDLIEMGRLHGVKVDLDVRNDDLADRVKRIFTPAGLDNTGRLERFVPTSNRSEDTVFYRPVNNANVWIRCPTEQNPISYFCSMEYMRAKTVGAYVLFPKRHLAEWQALKALVDSVVVVGSST